MNWISFGDINFKLFEFHKIKNKGFSNLELKHMIYAHAKFGGPLAITSDPDAFIMGSEANTDAIKNICIFKNDGSLLHKISKEGMQKIVGMDFLDEEYLFVMMHEGSFILVDPHKGVKKSYNLGPRFMAEPIIEAKVVDNSIVFYTNFNGLYNFYYVENIFAPTCKPFIHADIKVKPAFFVPISHKSSLSERLECLVTNPSAGIHRLIEDQDEMILFNSSYASTAFLANLPNIKEIRLIAVSPSQDIEKQMMAFFTAENSLYLVSSDFTKVLMRKDNVSKDLKDPKGSNWKRALKLLWCGEDAVVLFVGRTINIVTRDNTFEKEIKNTKALLPMQEVDGIKIISSGKCEVLRALPPSYVNIFKINSSAKAKDLYEAYEDYEQRQASYENNILTEKKGLQEAVEECIDAACFELSTTEQLRLLRAAHFGKTFLNPNNSTFDHNKFSQACKILRVISSFRNENLCRAITYQQFLCLSEAEVIRILIRYQLYYLADEVCKFLNYPAKLTSQVYVNWAIAKIESAFDTGENPEKQQEALAVAIYEKLKNEATISFAVIARKAVELGKKHLARKLLENEKSFSKKLQVLLEMKDYINSLREAIYSRDPNLIEMVIFKMQNDTSLPRQSVWSLLSKTPLSKKLLLEYLRNFNPQTLDEFMIDNSSGDERALIAIKNAYFIKELPQRMTLLKDFALKFFKDKFCEDVTREQYEFLSELIKSKGQQAEELSINKHLYNLFQNQKFDEAEKVRKKFKISERNFYTIQARAFIDGKKWDELERLLADKNKKYATIPWFSIVDMLSDAGEGDKAEKYVVKLSDVEEQLTILKMMNKFRTAADVAFNNKRRDFLEELLLLPSVDNETKDAIDNMLGSMKRR